MADEDKNLGGMDAIDQTPAPAQADGGQPDQQHQQTAEERARDEAGRFAPRGQPSEEHARRREAQERDEARREAQQAKDAHQALQKRLDDMSSLIRGEDPDAPPANPLDPVLQKIESIDKRLTDRDQQAEAERVDAQVRSYADQDEARFRQQQPDFPNAVQHYIGSRVREMQAFGLTEEQAGQQLAAEAQQLLFQAAQQGQSPSQIIYQMAQARGYAGQGASNVVDMPAQRQPAPANTGGRSFGNGAGAPGGAMTAAQIASMDESDYLAFRSTPEGKRAIQRAMGG